MPESIDTLAVKLESLDKRLTEVEPIRKQFVELSVRFDSFFSTHKEWIEKQEKVVEKITELYVTVFGVKKDLTNFGNNVTTLTNDVSSQKEFMIQFRNLCETVSGLKKDIEVIKGNDTISISKTSKDMITEFFKKNAVSIAIGIMFILDKFIK